MKLTTAAQMKELDRQAIEERGIPSLDLMERAAAGVAEAARALRPPRPGRSRGAALCGAPPRAPAPGRGPRRGRPRPGR